MTERLWDPDETWIWYHVPEMITDHIANLHDGFRGVDVVFARAIDLLDAGDVDSMREVLETALAELRAALRVH